MMLPPLNLDLTLEQQFKLKEIYNELHQPGVSTKQLSEIAYDLTRQLMIQRNVTAQLIKTIVADNH